MFENLFARRGFSMDRLRVLCEVAAAGSIARAAGRDPVRQSQFSRQLKELENFFEIELTRRHGKVLVLTDAGKELVQIARETMGRLEDFQQRALDQPVSFALGAGDSLIHWLVLPRLGALPPALRGVNLRIENLRSSEITNRLHDLSLDLGIVRRDAVSAPLATAPLGKMDYSLFCAKTSAKKLPEMRCVFQTMPVAMQSGDGAFMQQFRAWAEKSGLKVSIKLECDSFPQASRAVRSGHFASVLPGIARGELPGSEFWELDIPGLNKEPRPICLAWNPRIARLRGAAEDLINHCKRVLKF